MAEEKKTVISLSNIIKRFYIGKPNELQILNGINLEVREGEFVAIVGQSGSGKTTLMNLIGLLDRPTEGEYIIDGLDTKTASDKELSIIRNRKIGFVFQTYNLVSKTDALKNVELPMLYAGVRGKDRAKRATELLKLVDMEDRMKHLPEELSGGQKQRVAIARAMANNPAIILADEPTGALDSKTGRQVMDLFHKLNKEQGKTILLITHSNELAEETDRIITIKDGYITGERPGLGHGPETETFEKETDSGEVAFDNEAESKVDSSDNEVESKVNSSDNEAESKVNSSDNVTESKEVTEA